MDIEIILENGTCIDYFNAKFYSYNWHEYEHYIVTVDNEKVTIPDSDIYKLCIMSKIEVLK